MKIEIKATNLNDEAIKILIKCVKKLYSPYNVRYYGIDDFYIKVGE